MATQTKRTSASIDKLLAAIDTQNSSVKKERPKDERYWKQTVDKAGNGSAIIRFLPAPKVDGEDALPWIRYWDHGFKGPTGKWYIERSLKSIGKNDPVYEKNAQLYNANEDPDSKERKQAAQQKRRLHYVSNIYVVSDQKNPDAEGKVFLFKYGKKIFDKLISSMKQEFEDDTPVNPFDPVSGANFRLRQGLVFGFPNYDESKFDNPSALGTANDIDKIVSRAYSLQEVLNDPKEYKSYDELSAWLKEVLAEDVRPVAAAPKVAKATKSVVDDDPPFDVDEDDDELSSFKALAAE